MDFLDPRKRKAQRLRLMVGYVLIAVAIGLVSVILIYGAYGYGINTKTGQIIQNGLLFVDSHPAGAQIYLNGKYQGSNTTARLILPAGKYSLTIKRSGYQSWSRSFQLDAHTVARFTYPFLFPAKPRVTSLHNYSLLPSLITQSPDQRWLLVQSSASTGLSFDEYDTTNLAKAPVTLTIPTDLLTGGGGGRLSVDEWSTDNKNVLLKHTFSGGSEFIVFNRTSPADSFNVNKLFGVNPTNVMLKNKSVSQLYVYDQSHATLSIGNTSNGSLASPLLTQVLAFRPYSNNLILYVSDKGTPAGDVQARVWDSGKTYPLYTFPAGSVYLINIAKYANHWYYVAGSNATARVNIYKDPLNEIQDPSIARAVPLLSLNIAGATKVSFSNTAQFVEADNGRSFSVYDIENQNSYSYKLSVATAAPLVWMDGDRLIGDSNNKVYVIDYDSTNPVSVTPTVEADGGFFSADFNHLFTIQKSGSTYQLENVDMRAGVDLPTSPNA